MEALEPEYAPRSPSTSWMVTHQTTQHPMKMTTGRRRSTPTATQQEKKNKYGSIAARIGAELLPFAVESFGGMAPDAFKLIHTIAEEGEDTMRMWSSGQIARHSLCLTATAVQRGNAMMMLHGYTQCRHAAAAGAGSDRRREAGERI